MAQPPSTPQPPSAADEATEQQLLGLASTALRTRRLGEVEEIRVAVQWAVVHGEPRPAEDGERDPRRDPMVTPGGDGTPPVREHAIAELAFARQTHPATTRALIADGLDLHHRLPLTWAVVEAGDCEPWVARKVAVLCRALLSEQVGVVDSAVAKAIAGHAPSTVLEIARAKTIEADPDTHHAEQDRIRHERYVRLSRSDEHGYRHLIARITLGDAATIDAMLDRVADILATSPDHAMGADHNHDELRSLALGWLARPADLLQLLLAHTEPADDTEPVEDESEDPEDSRPAWAPDHLHTLLGHLAGMSTRQLASLRPKARLFVHITDDTLRKLLTRTGTGVARVEGIGPLDARQLAEVLGTTDLTITPVLDLQMRRRVDAYEHPEDIKDHAWTQTGGDCYPYSPRSATRDGVDYDHAQPYDDTGPPGQTGTHNCGPLRRSHHRTKTHSGITTRLVGPGRHLWHTPHGQALLVDHRGTTPLTTAQAQAMADAIDDGVELYWT
ncbi:hypothetical protein KDN32_15310 [Nocardioides sp. J2M5]|uniref:hypothetical protein n=1 Tax=Nocardioides palaemonis TaxID=2829810 RepID=UPI001BAC32D7|nr:hypothetical protein [Nocardioides palaemonis]MBS2939108.1 hypothetical protein [Nocardioides palaemonis]